jgi:hypothetical protein
LDRLVANISTLASVYHQAPPNMGPEKLRKRWENVAKRKKRLLLVKTVKTHDFPFDHGEYARKTRRIW